MSLKGFIGNAMIHYHVKQMHKAVVKQENVHCNDKTFKKYRHKFDKHHNACIKWECFIGKWPKRIND